MIFGAPPANPARRRYRDPVNILQTLAIFLGIPLLVYLILALLTLVPGRAKKHPRYRPGQPWDFPPQLWAGDEPVVVPQAAC